MRQSRPHSPSSPSRWVLCLAPLLLASVATAAEKTPEWRAVDVWRQAQGLPQNTVMTIRQTRDGYLWLGTKGGVARFDGLRFTVWDDRDKTQLRENEVWALAEGDDGSLFVGTYGGGVSRLKDGRFAVYTTRDGLVNDYVNDMCKDPTGVIWMSTDGGVSRFFDGRFSNITVADGLPHKAVRSLLCEADGTVWIGTSIGTVSRFKEGRLTAEVFPDVTPGAEVKAFCRDRTGALWIATTDGVVRARRGESRRFTTKDGLAANWTLAVTEDEEGNIWVGNQEGLDRFEPERQAFSDFGMDRTSVQTVKSLFADHEGNLWVGGLIDGLSRMRKTPFVTYGVADGLAERYVTAVFEDSRRNVWLGTAAGLNRLKDGVITTYRMADPTASNRITALAEDRAGHLWVGTNQGLYRLELNPNRADGPGRFVPARYAPLPIVNIRIIHAARDGSLWIGTSYEGVLHYVDGRFTRITAANGLANDAVRAIAEGLDGTLWIGTKGGLTRLKDGVFTVLRERDGLAHDSVESLYMDGNDTLWIATRQAVHRLKDGQFRAITVAEGLHTNYVYCFVAEDDQGNLWMNSSKGVFRVRKQDLEDVADGKARSVTSIAYGLEHGLSSTVGVISQHPVAVKTHDGRVWFCTLRGVCVVDPKMLPSSALPPQVHIEEVRVDRTEVFGEEVKTGPVRGDLMFRYTGLSFLAPDKITFRYRLEGYDRDWVDAGPRRVAYYTNIPPGHYLFRVLASSNDNVWSPVGAARDLDLAPHLYQTTVFRVAVVLVAGLLALGIHLGRVKVLGDRSRELTARVNDAMAQVKTLRGLLPICAACKKVRDDTGYWNQIETYIHERSEAEFSHSICPECMQKLYPEFQTDGPAEPPHDEQGEP